jgi:small-conductance mechanosensitive channel
MTITQWIMLIAAIIYVCLMAVAFKFPRTRENWTKERKESLQIAMSVTVFLMLFFLLWYASSVIDWPDAIVITVWVCAFTFLGLILVGIFAPDGVKVRFDRKKDAKAPDEDE